MYIRGISCFFHDAVAALLEDGRLVAAAGEERFSRRKHDDEFPVRAIASVLAARGITARDLDDLLVLGNSIVRKRRGDAQGLDAAGRRLAIAAELLAFFWARRLWWLIPMVTVRLALGLVLVFAHSSGIAPFVYTLF